jgi:hypothetical protein
MSTYAVRFTEENSEKIARLLDFVRSLDFVDSVEPLPEYQILAEASPSDHAVPAAEELVASLEFIKKYYPNQWVLIANPQRKGSLLISGQVVLAAPDKRNLALKAKDLLAKYPGATHFFTGEKPRRGHVGLVRKVTQ